MNAMEQKRWKKKYIYIYSDDVKRERQRILMNVCMEICNVMRRTIVVVRGKIKLVCIAAKTFFFNMNSLSSIHCVWLRSAGGSHPSPDQTNSCIYFMSIYGSTAAHNIVSSYWSMVYLCKVVGILRQGKCPRTVASLRWQANVMYHAFFVVFCVVRAYTAQSTHTIYWHGPHRICRMVWITRKLMDYAKHEAFVSVELCGTIRHQYARPNGTLYFLQQQQHTLYCV